MSHTFSALSHADFEDLARDLAGAELGVRFEAFGPGPDGGIDGRHAQHNGLSPIILQAKHYENSTFSQLKSAMRSASKSIDKLSPARYMLITSCKLTPARKTELISILGHHVKNPSDILGFDDVRGLLRAHPSVEARHIKLWLSSAGVLDKILHSASYNFAAISKADIEAKVKIYAQNPSFEQSSQILEDNHVLIVSGPPGVGKTTLAEMLSYAYLGKGWTLVPIRSLDDGFAAIKDSQNQIFLFDDFLGKVALDKHALAHKDSDLARFIKRIRNSQNGRFILTTRAYIFEEARRVSEHLADPHLDVTKYVLDVGIYTRRIRARILYNHLAFSNLPSHLVASLLDSGKLAKIVDHKNYNPRVIEQMTDLFRLKNIESANYAAAFIEALDNPKQLWDTAFRTHIDDRARHFLIALFFCSEYGVDAGELRKAFDALHAKLAIQYGMPRNPQDFEECLKILEGGFIIIQNNRVQFVNPSLRDFLSSYLDDITRLITYAGSSQNIRWASSLWRFGTQKPLSDEHVRAFSLAFKPIARQFNVIKVWEKTYSPSGDLQFVCGDEPNTARISLLLDWWRASQDDEFETLLLQIASNPVEGFDSWRDGTELVDLILELEDPGYGILFVKNDELKQLLEQGLVNVSGKASSDDLEKISDAVDQAGSMLSSSVATAVEAAVVQMIDDFPLNAEYEDSESTLNDHRSSFQRLAVRYSIPSASLNAALDAIEERIDSVRETSNTSDAPSIPSSAANRDFFEDRDLNNLFASLRYLGTK